MQKVVKKSAYPQFIKNRVYRVIINYSYKPNCVSSGAGFFISRNQFLTCFHVVFGNELVDIRKDLEFLKLKEANEHENLKLFFLNTAPSIQVELGSGIRVNAVLRKFDQNYDAALLDVDVGQNKANICLLNDNFTPDYGDSIVFGGFPNQFSYKYDETPFGYHEGMISSFPVTIIGGGRYEHLQINSINLSGNSGAPLFIKGKKEVIGVINGNMNWGRDDLLSANNNIVSNRVPLSIAYSTTIKTLKEKTSIFSGII
ncbi:MAG: trypsin-like peptidase domain-containing protein [Candidatus Zambryskibacteria bacterium]|nr:trypsin-like peptidase domain-containing protein [Candidatus Zambryskibacteria bacterium]